jgi:hypothetical protein
MQIAIALKACFQLCFSLHSSNKSTAFDVGFEYSNGLKQATLSTYDIEYLLSYDLKFHVGNHVFRVHGLHK